MKMIFLILAIFPLQTLAFNKTEIPSTLNGLYSFQGEMKIVKQEKFALVGKISEAKDNLKKSGYKCEFYNQFLDRCLIEIEPEYSENIKQAVWNYFERYPVDFVGPFNVTEKNKNIYYFEGNVKIGKDTLTGYDLIINENLEINLKSKDSFQPYVFILNGSDQLKTKIKLIQKQTSTFYIRSLVEVIYQK